MYMFATPQPTFFDRSDLDTLAVDFSETATVHTTATVTATVTDSSGTQSSTQNTAITNVVTWHLLQPDIATFQVLGKDYANVVQVHQVTTSTDDTTGQSSMGMNVIWLAKGIGIIRSETTTVGPSGTDNQVNELVSTNLVAP